MFVTNLSFKPDCNRMVAEKLGTTTEGCNCQKMLLIIVQNGEVMSSEQLTPNPCHLVKFKPNEKWGELTQKGEGVYKKDQRGSYNLNYFSEDHEIKGIPRPGKYIETIRAGDSLYYQVPCYSADEMTYSFFDYDIPDEIKTLPNGIYQILVEHACYSYTTMDGTEGDSESDFKIYDYVPLYYYLKHKDSLIAELEPESEELVSRYLYIHKF